MDEILIMCSVTRTVVFGSCVKIGPKWLYGYPPCDVYNPYAVYGINEFTEST